MTLDDYMNAENFPMTSHSDYSPVTQLKMDAFNLDQMVEGIEMGHKLTSEEAARFQELKTKEPHIGPLARELRAAEVVQQAPNACTPRPFKVTRDEVLDLIRRNRASLEEESRTANSAIQLPASGDSASCDDQGAGRRK